MSDSNPRRGWDNTWQSIQVLLGALGLVILVLLFWTGHTIAAWAISVIVAVVLVTVLAVRAGQHERDH